jgi:hypothetical protein
VTFGGSESHLAKGHFTNRHQERPDRLTLRQNQAAQPRGRLFINGKKHSIGFRPGIQGNRRTKPGDIDIFAIKSSFKHTFEIFYKTFIAGIDNSEVD